MTTFITNDVSTIQPIGHVENTWKDTMAIPLGGAAAVIHIKPEYQPALYRIGEHSHLWILSWFDQADRSILRVVPSKVNPDLPEYGVFGLRSSARPNPIALTVVKLEKVADGRLTVSGMDAVDGTPVLDIKPYCETDIVFSSTTPYLPPREYQTRKAQLYKQAVAYHGEHCLGLVLAVNMALLVERHFGQLHSPDLKLTVEGDACFADVLQGLTRARLANPARFCFRNNSTQRKVHWEKYGENLMLMVRPNIDLATVNQLSEQELFV